MVCLGFGNGIWGRTGRGWVESCRLSDWKHSAAEALFFNPADNIVPALFIFLLELLLNIPPSLSLHYILSASSGVHFHYRDLSHSPFRCHSRYCVAGIFRLAVPTNSSHRVLSVRSAQGAKKIIYKWGKLIRLSLRNGPLTCLHSWWYFDWCRKVNFESSDVCGLIRPDWPLIHGI